MRIEFLLSLAYVAVGVLASESAHIFELLHFYYSYRIEWMTFGQGNMYQLPGQAENENFKLRPATFDEWLNEVAGLPPGYEKGAKIGGLSAVDAEKLLRSKGLNQVVLSGAKMSTQLTNDIAWRQFFLRTATTIVACSRHAKGGNADVKAIISLAHDSLKSARVGRVGENEDGIIRSVQRGVGEAFTKKITTVEDGVSITRVDSEGTIKAIEDSQNVHKDTLSKRVDVIISNQRATNFHNPIIGAMDTAISRLAQIPGIVPVPAACAAPR